MRTPKAIIVTLVLLLNWAVSSSAQTSRPDHSSVHFAVIGDRTGNHVAGVYEQAVDEIERLRPDFVVTVGDQIEGYTVDTSVLRSEWDEYYTIVSRFTMPLYITPGNHDITYDAALPTFEKRVGKPYRSFDIGTMHFVILDNSRCETSDKMEPAQVKWLADDLASHTSAEKTFVFFHKPFWYNSTALGKSDTLHTLFVKYGVDAVFTGHFHQYFSGTYDGIAYTGVGSSGGAMGPSDPADLGYHFAWVTVDSEKIVTAPVKVGSVRPWDALTAAELHATEKVSAGAITFSNPVPVNEDLTIPQTKIMMTAHNQMGDVAVRDTIQWTVPAGWSISPSAEPLVIDAGGSANYPVTVQSSNDLYPLPQVRFRLPFAPGRTMLITETLPIARQASCYRATKAPAIDGKLIEPIWKDPVTRFFNPDTGPVAIESTYFYFAYDDRNLYVAARCKESKPDSLRTSVTKRDGPVYSDDCIGLYLQPDLSRDSAYQIYFSALGTTTDQRLFPSQGGEYGGDRKWDGSYTVKASRDAGYWIVEAQIPLKQFGVKAKPGLQMGLNFLRKQQRLQDAANWQAPIDYNPNSYGRLTFK
ncbi:MAG: metallophosphoesterase [Candidatus Zixiibacteriota bacterium]